MVRFNFTASYTQRIASQIKLLNELTEKEGK